METVWRDALALSDLKAAGRKVVKLDGKQIAVFWRDGTVYACNNRCPHEGFPLVEGTVSDTCTLTCNWHNWKFDLADGSNLRDGDKLRVYPTRVDGDRLLIDIADPPSDQLIDAALANIVDALPKHEYDRIGREVARLEKAGGDPLDAVRASIADTADRMEYGWTHAYAATADWLSLRARLDGSGSASLAPIMESIGHMSWDTMRERHFPFTTDSKPYDEDTFVAAIEVEDEHQAMSLMNGALRENLGFDGVKHGLIRAALAHYQGFGHAMIYVYKTGELIDRLGAMAVAPLLQSLTRYLVYTTREDLIPEFKAYRPARDAWDAWDGKGATATDAEVLSTLPMHKAMVACNAASADPDVLYATLLDAVSLQFLRFDTEMDHKADNPVSQNVSWLDFTHAITFANAGRWAAEIDPAFWPDVLLQMACFLGRNVSFQDSRIKGDAWVVRDPAAFFDDALMAQLNHDHPEYIVSCHYVKLLTAAKAEVAANPDADFVATLGAAINRMIAHPIRRKHIMRTANQSLDFVAREG